jgi:hypothetical protein
LIVFDLPLEPRTTAAYRERMPSWNEFEKQEPEFAASVRGFLDAHVHKTIATLRRDGSPRICGTETRITEGELWIGSMPNALKARDLGRDPRYALHSGSDDPPNWVGDAKVAGRAEEITDPETVARINDNAPPGPSHLFRLDITEASTVRLNDAGDGVVVTVWTPDRGIRKLERG